VEDGMGKILCATRGGEASYRTQDAAIALAKERGDELLFLFVVDIGFLDRTERAVRRDVVTHEMEKMGEFLLVMAQERALAKNVHADYLVRHGKFREELIACAQQPDVTMVVLGKPAGKESAFIPESLEAFAGEIQAKTGTPVRII
jgi:nucleotide-binding universal stress UspA family protein